MTTAEKISVAKKGKRTAIATEFKRGHSVHPKAIETLKEWRDSGGIPWNKGRKIITNTGRTHFTSERLLGNKINVGRIPWNKSIGSKTPLLKRLRSSLAYRAWRRLIFERDDYTCQFCGKRGGTLNADHIEKFAECPERRFDVSNGRTLCKECHLKTETFGNRRRAAV